MGIDRGTALRPDVASAPAPLSIAQLFEQERTSAKFDLEDLMDTLRDRRHEGWILAAYPDPKTSRPLIGAGFTLDLPARDHAQTNPLNAHPFIEPSSAELWQAAGLDSGRLDRIIDRYRLNLKAWKKKKFQKKMAGLEPEITDEEATGLLRVAAEQAIYNARGYCRYFDRYSASQQMALSQLVYQMGVNLAEFTEFLNLINQDSAAPAHDLAAPVSDAAAPAQSGKLASSDGQYWKSVQASLIHSQWARLYRTRAVAVIAMLDPEYSAAPRQAEGTLSATLRPAVLRRHRGAGSGSLRNATYAKSAARTFPAARGRSRKTGHKKKSRPRND